MRLIICCNMKTCMIICIVLVCAVKGSLETHITGRVCALTVQFDGVEKELKCRPLQRLPSGKSSSSEPSVGERIDPAVPLESQFWYHGAISRTDAEALLRLCKEASYLVRNSETCKNDFSLSLK
ncbi:SH2 domain-containing adapter protein F-like [Puntigrus tetrazona]|uniref:SH2 domain-containing adapter protein F-like n=1 Tax=Puntigrus tetrazona TaxID=1606681 RepID=UPI001C8B072A|nr:SH2 domain-containing adapter protein F-like [Puntigrus tetrazona]